MITEDLLAGLEDDWEEPRPPADPDFSAPILYTNQPINHWDPRLILDLALGLSPTEDVLARHGVDELVYRALCNNSHFRRELASAKKDLHENGISFKAKAKIQAESYLPVIDEIINSETSSASVKLEAIKQVVEWADLKPKKEVGPTQATQVNVNIVI